MKKNTEAYSKPINLFSLDSSPKELRKINQIIEQQKSRLFVLIHPFFLQNHFGLTHMTITEAIDHILNQQPDDLTSVRKNSDTRRNKIRLDVTELTAKSYYHRLKRVVQHPNAKLLLLGEVPAQVDRSAILLRELGFKGTLLSYKTKTDESTPNESEGNWDTLVDALLALNFDQLIVGDQFTRFDPHMHDASVPIGCVPGFVRSIEERIQKLRPTDFIISPVTYPNWWTYNLKHPYFRPNKKINLIPSRYSLRFGKK